MATDYKHGRINEETKKALAEVLRSIKDPRIPEFVSVMHVEVSPDLKYAKAYLSFLGTYEEREVRRGLKAANGFIRKRLGETLRMRLVPELTFEIDHTAETGARIEQLLKQVAPQEDERS